MHWDSLYFDASFWDDILEPVNKTNGTLQNLRLDVNTAVAVLTSLKTFIETKRDSFEEYETKWADLYGCTEYATRAHHGRKISMRLSPLDTSQAPETELTPVETFTKPEVCLLYTSRCV